MDSLLGNYDNLTVPLVSDEYLKTHPYKNNNEIVSEIDSVLDLNNITTDINESSYFNTVSIKGTFVGGKSVDEDDDWKDMNKKLDEVLKKLEENSWSGYKTLTAYFTNYKVNSDGNYEFEVNFHGISTDSSVENKAPVINAELDSLGVVNEGIKFNGEKSQDEDGTIKEYLWDFGDGTTSKEVKGIHKYEKEGVYKVKLKVTDDKGAQSEKTFEIRIAKEESSCRTIESEPNDSFNNANGGVFSGEAISASFTKGDSSDIFYFDVEKEGEVTIDVKNPNNLGVNWLLFKEGDLNNYISYASKEGDSLINKVNLSPGRYYVNIYSYDRNKLGDYTLTITGGLKTSSENGFVDEVENNNNFDEAMKITKNKGISAYIDDKDAVDIYTFTLDKPLDIEILLEKQNHMKLNWILYHESDLNNYVSYANIEGNTLKNTYKAKPGKYYIGVYKYDKNTEGAYTLKLGSALE
ncbi:PKD domain-containing protein [Clostridium sp.]|uniref:PKD domain-containing protein n=1 Tax=Clostridium sp. TaxID=1506 RepID=UPI003463A11D